MKKNNNIAVLTLGCSKNVYDSEVIIGKLIANKLNVTYDINNASAVIINTCGFIEQAKQENIDLILQICELKKSNKIDKIIVVGCLSQRYSEALKSQIKEVDYFFGINPIDDILNVLSSEKTKVYTHNRELLTPKHYAYLKISDGCNHSCSFCAIPLIKGKYASTPIENLIAEAKILKEKGVKELNIIAQDTTYYGTDIYKKNMLADLLKRLDSEVKFDWIRIMYTYPKSFPYDVLDVIAESENICKYIDIPLQHISENILNSMKRPMKKKDIYDLLEKIRKKVPNITIRSTFIVGYPLETKKEFKELRDFLKEVELDRVGIFTYSPEEDTSAYNLGNPIPNKTKEERRAELMELQQGISLKKNKGLIGKTIKVLVDSKIDNSHWEARSEKDAPDVDNSVIIHSKKEIEVGGFVNVTIKKAEEYDVFGSIA